ncbi:MAG: hypothetical protein ACI867_002167 [Glaciecola sp.]
MLTTVKGRRTHGRVMELPAWDDEIPQPRRF